MAKKKNNNANNNAKEVSEVTPIEKSDEVLTVETNKPAKKNKADVQSKDAKNKAKQKKPKDSFFKKIGNFFKGIISELKKVSWPTFMQALKQTGAVLVIVGVFMVVVLGIDGLLAEIVKLLLPKS